MEGRRACVRAPLVGVCATKEYCKGDADIYIFAFCPFFPYLKLFGQVLVVARAETGEGGGGDIPPGRREIFHT